LLPPTTPNEGSRDPALNSDFGRGSRLATAIQVPHQASTKLVAWFSLILSPAPAGLFSLQAARRATLRDCMPIPSIGNCGSNSPLPSCTGRCHSRCETLSIEVCIKKRARGGVPPLALAAAADRRFAIVFDVARHLPSQILLQTLGNFRLVKVCELRIKVGNASKAEAKRVGRACCSALPTLTTNRP
jgi:hypothetical protein